MSGKILIVDDQATSRIVLKAQLSPAFYEVAQAADGASALAMARHETPDLVLLDMRLPDMDGTEVCARLQNDPATRDIPVVVISALDTPAARLAALEAGADDYLPKPVDGPLLLARLRSLIRAREAGAELALRDETCRNLGLADPSARFDGPARIVLIGANPSAAVVWRTSLSARMTDRIETMTRAEALAETGSPTPVDVFVLIAENGAPDPALGLMSELRSRSATRHAAVCVILGGNQGGRHDGFNDDVHEGAMPAAMALDLGAGDVVAGASDPNEVALRLTRLIIRKRRADRLRASASAGWELALTDPLTGLHNRRYALPHLARIVARAEGTRRRFAVMVIDLDRFKSVNDRWGHAAGDAVLCAVARRLADNLRAGDLVARIGGEEFLVVMPDADPSVATRAAERLRRVVEATPVPLPEGGAIGVTLSIGVAIADPRALGHDTADALIARADRALLAAKAEGRNQVTTDRPAA